jgi:hypothetical protein
MRNLTLLLLLLFSLTASGQDSVMIKIGFFSGFDFYSQAGLRARNQYVINREPFDVKIIDDFVPRPVIGSYFQYVLTKRVTMGPEYTYHYTGSRIGARDYSGTFSFDQYVKVHQIGLKFDYSVLIRNHSSVILEMSTGAGFTNYKIESDLQFGENLVDAVKDAVLLKGISWYTRPALQYQFSFRHLDLFGSICYSSEPLRKFKYENNVIKQDLPSCKGFNMIFGIDYAINYISY